MRRNVLFGAIQSGSFLEWPREGMLAMGFVTGRAYTNREVVNEATGETATKEQTIALVYIPTVPNPTSGNMALVIEDDLVETNMTVDEAMRLVFSGGIIMPENINLFRIPLEFQKAAGERYENELTGRFHVMH